MRTLLKALMVVMLLVFVVSALVAGGLFWSVNFGDCKDGCESGMVFIYFLPALVVAGLSAFASLGLHLAVRRMK